MSDNCIIGDLISRKALLDGLACPDNRTDSPEEIQELADYYAFKRYVQAAPAVDAAPIVHAVWKEIGADKRGRGGIFKCTACGGCHPHTSKRCSDCGAIMNGGAEG